MSIVYLHRRLSDNEIFYVGIGYDVSRAYDKKKRSVWWNRVVEKHGYSVEIAFEDVSDDRAKELEIGLIRIYGRADLKKGNLVNMTDGGDGLKNYVCSDETREKLRRSREGYVFSEETKKKISEKSKGRKLSPENIAKCRAAAKRFWSELSPEKYEEMCLAKRNKSPETLEKIGAASRGRRYEIVDGRRRAIR